VKDISQKIELKMKRTKNWKKTKKVGKLRIKLGELTSNQEELQKGTTEKTERNGLNTKCSI
jgi:hypothetical protein